jgi:hypothetical protein
MVTVTGLTYHGKEAVGFYSDAILADGFKGTLTQIANAKGGHQFAKLSLDDLLQPFTCSWNATATATLNTKKFVPAKFSINGEMCADDLWSSYLSAQTNGTTDVMPAEFEAYIMDLAAKEISKGLDNLIINGSIAGGDNMDGLLVQFAADAAVIDVTGAFITEANVMAELAKVHAAIPLAILDKATIFVPKSVEVALRKAFASANPALCALNIDAPLNYLGVPIEVIKWLPAGADATPDVSTKMFACDRANLVILTEIANEVTDIQLIDMSKTNGTPNVRLTGAFTYGVSYFNGAEIVYYA